MPNDFSPSEIKILRRVCFLYKTDKVPKSKERFKNLIESDKAFSKREIDILFDLCNELTHSEIAKRQKISVRTVDHIKLRLLNKTKSKNLAGLVKFAIRHRIYILK